MSTALATNTSESITTLAPSDAAAFARVAKSLRPVADGRVDDPNWVAASRQAWDDLPVALRRAVRRFRRDSGQSGTLLLRGLPIQDPLSPTPFVAGSVQREATVSAAVLLMIAAGLGDPAAFLPEKSGALVQNVVPVPGKEDFQGNAGSVLLTFHTENAFHPHRPDFVMLLCLRADHERVAGLRTACVREVFPLLTDGARTALFNAEFATEAPPSFGNGGGVMPPHAVLSGDPADPDLVVDFAATTALTPRAGAALIELRDLFERTARTLRAVPGDLAIVDNRVTVHGRTAFRPRYDGADRWLQRTFVLTDLRRSRDHRPADGYVLTK